MVTKQSQICLKQPLKQKGKGKKGKGKNKLQESVSLTLSCPESQSAMILVYLNENGLGQFSLQRPRVLDAS